MTTEKLLAFHGDAATKKKYLDRVKKHRLADEIVHGLYWERGKGCAVGCTIHSGDHASYETELGIPADLARLEDSIFEAMENGDSKKWPEQFLAAPRVGADLSMVWPRFALWLLADKGGPVYRSVQKRKAAAEAVAAVAALFARWIKTGTKPERAEWETVRSASYDASYAAAYAASAASYAAAFAASAASYAAAASDAYAARSQARATFWLSARDKLLQLMKAAPVAKRSRA